MSHGYFFGYGSLVNRRTHTFDPAFPARITGWRRAWRYTKDREVAYLTVVRDPRAEIDGLIAAVPAGDWAALDERERAYARHSASADVWHESEAQGDIAIYAIAPERLHHPDADHPVLLSYIDVVVQGFLLEYGAAGAERFFATTTGWEAPIVDDRSRPRYPRAQLLTDEERAVVDGALARLGCSVLV